MGLSSLHPSRNKGMMRVNRGPTLHVKHRRYHGTTAKLPFCIYSVGKESWAPLPPPIIPTLKRLGRKTESATRRLGQHMGYEVEAGGSQDADVGISQD